MSHALSKLETYSPWPHRLARAMVCATFPLIWVGGLVTTYDAGMAVPDWPSTYGYNLFLYPWQTWIAGPWDLFIEHGHRLLGAVVGFITIGFVVAVWLKEDRPWMRVAAVAALAAVIFQGVLGGQRVLLDSRTVAMLHGCFAPAFFAYCAALAVLTSRWWREASRPVDPAAAARFARLAIATVGVAYLQVILGAQLRHRDPSGDPHQFRMLVLFHGFTAFALAAHAILLLRRSKPLADQPLVRLPAKVLTTLLSLQLMLGAGTWVVKYGWPVWFAGFAWAQGHVNTTESLTQVLITTAHVALGSSILAVSLIAVLRGSRAASFSAGTLRTPSLALEAVR
jgi:cytochrome c oxidase assembly protein subunit 15